MFYPQRPDYPCETCHKGTKKWRGEVFASTYVLGYHYCDNPDCPDSAEARFNLAKFQENMKKTFPSK